MLRSIFLVLVSLAWGQISFADPETELSEFTELSFRGSSVFTQPQLAVILFDSLEPHPSDGHRNNGYLSCKRRGKIPYTVEFCRIDANSDATIKMITEPFIGFEIRATKPEFFAGLSPDESGWIQCEKTRSICRFRVK